MSWNESGKQSRRIHERYVQSLERDVESRQRNKRSRTSRRKNKKLWKKSATNFTLLRWKIDWSLETMSRILRAPRFLRPLSEVMFDPCLKQANISCADSQLFQASSLSAQAFADLLVLFFYWQYCYIRRHIRLFLIQSKPNCAWPTECGKNLPLAKKLM